LLKLPRIIPFDPKKEAVVESLFRDNFEALTRLATKYIGDFDNSKDIVHEVFIAFWQKFDTLPADTQYKSYLFTAVRNKSLNYLRDHKKHLNIADVEMQTSSEGEDSLESQELAREIDYALNLLPERCREVFELSRFEGMKYTQIADQLDISIKTVEAQMSKALRLMRDHLKDFLVLLITLFGFG
jgi:RNA polymerase sigma-70 factor (ECF subfamily)